MSDDADLALRYFLRLADKGVKPGASTYERRAWLVAVAVVKMLDGADDRAVQGMADFAVASAGHPVNAGVWVSERVARCERSGQAAPGWGG